MIIKPRVQNAPGPRADTNPHARNGLRGMVNPSGHRYRLGSRHLGETLVAD